MERDLQDIKAEIRSRISIVDVINQYTTLKRAGKSWKGLCPFHADKSPSFDVSEQFHSYRCWSCGEKGDLFTFVQKKENLDFIEAVEVLAKRAGIAFERKGVSTEQMSERRQLLEINQLALSFFQDRLTRSQEARDYLAGRKLLKSTQDRWELGYAPSERQLFPYLDRKGVPPEMSVKAGLLKRREQEGGGYYDSFRGRVIFPIRDRNGDLIGFGGRVMNPDDKPKYLNSPESAVFHKSRTLYGLYFAKEKLGRSVPPVFVEGYLDVITAHQAGFPQCVATLGTAMTEEHAKMLVNYSPRVILCYDADAAGIKAALTGALNWEKLGVEGAEVRVARLPSGDDPDSVLRRGDTALFQSALDNAVPRIDFQIELTLQRHDLHTEEGRAQALSEAIPILASVPALTMRDRYAQKLAYLHSSHSYNLGRAIEQILKDAEMYARQTRDGQSGRAQGYPRVEEANREPLKEPPPAPTFRPATAQNWGKTEWPHTQEVVRKGDSPGSYGGYSQGKQEPNGTGGTHGNNGNNGNWRRNKKPTGPPTDPTPPSLEAPLLTGAQKAERQLLRALFSPEWRVYLLSKLNMDLLVTEDGRRLLALLARTPAEPDGSINPVALLHRLEAKETQKEQDRNGSRDREGETYFHPRSGPSDMNIEPEAPIRVDNAKFSDYLRELLEDSPIEVSNDGLNERAVNGCIDRLRKHRNDREIRDILNRLQQPLSPEEQRALSGLYAQKMREMRGSPSTDAGG